MVLALSARQPTTQRPAHTIPAPGGVVLGRRSTARIPLALAMPSFFCSLVCLVVAGWLFVDFAGLGEWLLRASG